MNYLGPLFDICANRHRGNEQSIAANKAAKKSTERQQILEILNFGNANLTCEDLEKVSGISHQSCSARISELKRDGLIVKIGTRPTKSGCQAAVYKAV